MNWGNIISRAIWTFAQAALATFVGLNVAFDVASIKSAAIASAVAGGAALLSFIKTIIAEQLAKIA